MPKSGGIEIFWSFMDKFLIGMIWILSLFGAVFAGHEGAIMKHNLDRQVANDRLQRCQSVLVGGFYE